jgi:hypothetical protein
VRKPRRAADYGTAVVDVLADVGGFTDLFDPMVGSLVRDAVRQQVQQPEASFTCIVDNPSVANWRLCPHPDRVQRVRLSCYRPTPAAVDHERERMVNRALDQIPG